MGNKIGSSALRCQKLAIMPLLHRQVSTPDQTYTKSAEEPKLFTSTGGNPRFVGGIPVYPLYWLRHVC